MTRECLCTYLRHLYIGRICLVISFFYGSFHHALHPNGPKHAIHSTLFGKSWNAQPLGSTSKLDHAPLPRAFQCLNALDDSNHLTWTTSNAFLPSLVPHIMSSQRMSNWCMSKRTRHSYHELRCCTHKQRHYCPRHPWTKEHHVHHPSHPETSMRNTKWQHSSCYHTYPNRFTKLFNVVQECPRHACTNL